MASDQQLLMDAIRRGNPVVFFDITVGGIPAGRIKMELFADICPKVNFILDEKNQRLGEMCSRSAFTIY